MNTTHEYTDEQIQAAIDAAFPAGARPEGFNLDNRPSSIDWKLEAPNRLAIARAFLAALPKSAEADPYARLKAFAAAGARIRCTFYGGHWADWALNKHAAWSWCQPVDQYEVHPDDLHMVPEYAPKAAPWTLPAPPAGFRWHREDWTADMLPEGYRPLLDGEVIDKEDEFYYCGVGPWKSAVDASVYASGKRVDDGAVYFRTRRPLPADASAEPEQAQAQAQAKGIPLSEALGLPPGSFQEHLVETQEKENQEMREQQEHIKAARAKPDDIASKAYQYADYILNHYSKNSHADKLVLAKNLERHGWVDSVKEQAEEKPCGLNSALDEWSADDGPAWIPHDGGPCPIKDEEVEEWEFKFRDGDVFRRSCYPSHLRWRYLPAGSDIIACRVLRWKPGHGPQAAQYYMPKLPNPLAQPEPDTFEAHGKTWTRHTPGDPCPCDPEANIELLLAGGRRYEGQARFQSWGQIRNNPDNAIISWRYADEPAPAEAANTDTEWNEYQQELMSPLPKPWTPRPGDVVRLKSGGPRMTVTGPSPKDGLWETVWISNDGSFYGVSFPAACLTPTKEGQP